MECIPGGAGRNGATHVVALTVKFDISHSFRALGLTLVCTLEHKTLIKLPK